MQVLITVGFALSNAAIVVQALNLYHTLALRVHADDDLALAHGRAIFALEQRLHLAVEPAVQRTLASGMQTPAGVLAGTTLQHALVWVYLHAFPAWLLAALAWSYVYKPRQFGRLRDVTIVSALLAVLCYRLFPSAPPRFVLSGAPYHLQDWTYGGTAIDPNLVHVVGFNQYAAFPSVHFLWALIPALCLAYGSRAALVWLAALCYPLVMAVTVIGTGNHYVLDCVGSVAVLAAAAAIVCALHRARRWLLGSSLRDRYEMPAALSLCLCCAGTMAYAGIGGGVRHLVAADILILVVIASGRSPYSVARSAAHPGPARATHAQRLSGRPPVHRRGRRRSTPADAPPACLGAGLWVAVAPRLHVCAGQAYARVPRAAELRRDAAPLSAPGAARAGAQRTTGAASPGAQRRGTRRVSVARLLAHRAAARRHTAPCTRQPQQEGDRDHRQRDHRRQQVDVLEG